MFDMPQTPAIVAVGILAATAFGGCLKEADPGCDFSLLTTGQSDSIVYTASVSYSLLEDDGRLYRFHGRFMPGNSTVRAEGNVTLPLEAVREILWDWGELRRSEDFVVTSGGTGQASDSALSRLCESIIPTMMNGFEEESKTSKCYDGGIKFFKVAQEGRTVEYFRRCGDDSYPSALAELESLVLSIGIGDSGSRNASAPTK